MNKASELQSKSMEELQGELVELKKEQFNLRFQKATNQLENTARVRQVRRGIARHQTIINAKRAGAASEEQGLIDMPKRILQGAVVSDANDKTITVLVERRFMHPMVKKVVRRSKKYRAHDENNSFKVGDIVRIEECRPISKNKSWTVIEDAK